jgi:hypothetical protein
MKSTETWKDVLGYPSNTYRISDQGRVQSQARAIHRKDGTLLSIQEKILKPAVTGRGELQVVLALDPRRHRTHKIHTLVLTAFVGPRPKGKETVWINGNRQDCRLQNLKWGRAHRQGHFEHLWNELKPDPVQILLQPLETV